MSREIDDRSPQTIRFIAECAKSGIAWWAQESTHRTGFVIMIDGERDLEEGLAILSGTASNLGQVDIGLMDTADPAAEFLLSSQVVVLLRCYPVFRPQVGASNLCRTLALSSSSLIARHA